MMRIFTKSIDRPTGWRRRAALWTAVAGLVVVGTGGVALTSDAATPPAQIQACYQPAVNPSPLDVLHQAGSHCPTGLSPVAWNIIGLQGIPGPAGATGATGPQGPQGPQGLGGAGTGVTTANESSISIDGGPSHSVTVLTSPVVPVTGIYYVNASLSLQVASGDIVWCQLTPSSEPTIQQVGSLSTQAFASMALNGAVSLAAGQSVSVTCDDYFASTSTFFSEGDLNAVLISNPVGGGGSAP